MTNTWKSASCGLVFIICLSLLIFWIPSLRPANQWQVFPMAFMNVPLFLGAFFGGVGTIAYALADKFGRWKASRTPRMKGFQ
jgi:hypothetical protein